MNLKGSRSDSKPSRTVRAVRALVAGVAAVGAVATLAAGCLQRPLTEPTPRTSNVFVDQIRQTAVDKIDLLFMIDNSASMADKQQILAAAVPQLLNRLVNPDCVDAGGVHSAGQATCPNGSSQEFKPVNNIHIGVVTSSIGGHGADLCSPGSSQWVATQDDHAHLLPTVRTGLQDTGGLGFLAWGPGGITDAAALVTAFTPYFGATGAGEAGCGFEASLEAWYRFLVDPEPPTQVTQQNGQAVIEGPDQVTLDQRKAFLRADSLLAVIMLTDENDCSIVDGGIGWIVGSSTVGSRQFRMPSATTTCASDPNSPCCRSCGVKENSTPSGCTPLAQDANCTASATLSATDDPLNLRCWDHKRRFGIDLLYPTSRYVTGLTSPTVKNRAGDSVPNPIFSDLSGSGTVPRDSSLVFLAGIVGIPWQDIADDASLSGAGLRYLTADELQANGRWPVILGDPTASPPTPPSDALMVESNVPRTGAPYYPPGSQLGPANSPDPQANTINGHEYTPSATAGDLEYACIFPLGTPQPCTADDAACDCVPDSDGGITAIQAANRPLCQQNAATAIGSTQYWAKAYPGLRPLRVLRDFGKNSIVASICPKVTDPADTQNFGYNPAVAAIIDRLKEVLSGRCLPRTLGVNCDGTLQCRVLEAKTANCDCSVPGHDPVDTVDDATRAAVLRQLQASGVCGQVGQPACDTWCMCPVTQIQTDPQCTDTVAPAASSAGYCYIDADKGIGNPELVANCPDTQKRLLRFIGDNLPAKGAVTFIACAGATFASDQQSQCDAAP